MTNTVIDWQREYKDHQSSESPRYAVIANIINQFVLESDNRVYVLDAGCGEGYLLSMLDQHKTRDKICYYGVDTDGAALEEMQPMLRDGDSTVFAGVESWEPPVVPQFDIVVFNEVLYYLDDPEACLERYKYVLDFGGMFIVSMFQKKWPMRKNNRTTRLARRFLSQFKLKQDWVVRCRATNRVWEVFTFTK